MKGLTTAEMEIKMSFPDMEKMVVEFDVVFSKQEVEKKVERQLPVQILIYLDMSIEEKEQPSTLAKRQRKQL